LSGARIFGGDGQMPTVSMSRQSIRLDRAEIRSVKIEVNSTKFVLREPREYFDTSLEGTRINQSVISCRFLSPDSIATQLNDDIRRRENERRRMMSTFKRDLAFAHSLKALGDSNQSTQGRKRRD
jgi:hypothetical protein